MPRLYRLWLVTLLALALLLAAGVTLAQGPAPERPDPRAPATLPTSITTTTLAAPLPIDPDLLRAVLADPAAPVDVIVTLRDKADLSAAAAQPGKVERTQAVVSALKSTADRSQAALRADLAQAQAAGAATRVTPFWVTNAIAVQGVGALVLDLAARPDVEIIRPNRQWTLDAPVAYAPTTQRQDSTEWNIERLRADLVWSLMDIRGRGVVVASMDTGVDWQHPDLLPAYRGYNLRGMADHRGNWYCATDEGYLYPGDGVGHGTHTTGLMVGQSGVGVAPGAQWIAVKIFDDRSRTTDAWIHDGFQWLLAPAGDPGRAPDIVNGSWSSPARDSLIYRDDLRALRAAGILPVFSAGNDGPFEGSINIPGGYSEALTVGATDDEDLLASFSSRGPTPFATIKPDVVAPGVNIRSTYHGGGYAIVDGTSMATPQVAGIAALLRQANPRLTPQQMIDLIRGTARPIGPDPLPNNRVGAGLADAYGAVSMALAAGELAGRLTRVGDGGPVVGATVSATAIDNGATIRVQTDASGAYTVPLRAGTYTVSMSAFGYATVEQRGVIVQEARRTTLNAVMALLPVGVILGRVMDAGGAPLAAAITVEGTPVTGTAQANTGVYSLALPPGTYRLRVEMRGHRVGRGQVTIPEPGAAVTRDFSLADAPTILLVDGGAWYYADTLGYYQAALDARDYLYDAHPVRSVFDGAPTLEQLQAYDMVIWSSPKDSPRYVGADLTLTTYLAEGGRLILSGQDIAYWDGGGAGAFVASYFRGGLNARFVADQANAVSLGGVGPLAGNAWTLNGPDSADNQTSPDVIGAVKPEASNPAAVYPSGREAGILVDRCAPHRSLYFAFGLEGIQGMDARADLLDRAIHLMTDPVPDHAVAVHASSPLEVASAGSAITYTLTLRNLGSQADQYAVTVIGADWPTALIDPATGGPLGLLDVAACATRDVLVRVTIPPGSGWNAYDQAEVRVTSRDGGTGPISQTVQIESRTPAPVLLVDDDQWIDVQDFYTTALQSAAIPYDLWEVGHASGDGRGSPPAERLALYPIVVWFTGYDFLDALSPAEQARLADYLGAGGRLLLSSQDYLYTAGLNRFGIDYLGVLTLTEDLTTHTLLGVAGDPVGGGLGPFALDFEGVFRSARYNHSDALVPTAYATPTFVGDHSRPVGLRLDAGPFRTAFYAVPLETLPSQGMADVLARTVGWLQPLGASSLTPDRLVVADGDVLTYTLRVVNRGRLPRAAASATAVVPDHSRLVTDSVVGASVVDGRLTWTGPLPPGGVHTITYAVAVEAGLPPGATLRGAARVQDETGLASDLAAVARVNVPDLSPSFIVADRQAAQAGDRVTFVVSPRNQGTLDTTAALTVTLSPALTLLPDTVFATSGAAGVTGNDVTWRGHVPRGGPPTTLTFEARIADDYHGGPLTTTARIDDGFGVTLERVAVMGRDWQLFLPLLTRRARP